MSCSIVWRYIYAGGTAEAGGGAQVRGVGRAERGGAGVHGAVREGEAGPGGGPRRATRRPAPPHAVAGELRERQALPDPAHPLLLKGTRANFRLYVVSIHFLG
jgi:hypothetical protein